MPVPSFQSTRSSNSQRTMYTKHSQDASFDVSISSYAPCMNALFLQFDTTIPRVHRVSDATQHPQMAAQRARSPKKATSTEPYFHGLHFHVSFAVSSLPPSISPHFTIPPFFTSFNPPAPLHCTLSLNNPNDIAPKYLYGYIDWHDIKPMHSLPTLSKRSEGVTTGPSKEKGITDILFCPCLHFSDGE